MKSNNEKHERKLVCKLKSALIHQILKVVGLMTIFMHAGNLIQVTHERSRQSRSRLGSLGGKVESRKEGVRQCFLFTKHLLITSRTSGGKLHLAKVGTNM